MIWMCIDFALVLFDFHIRRELLHFNISITSRYLDITLDLAAIVYELFIGIDGVGAKRNWLDSMSLMTNYSAWTLCKGEMEDVKITPVLKRTQIKVKVIEIYTQVLGIGIKG